jgi:hypothetical protein
MMTVNNSQITYEWLYTFGQVQFAGNKHICTVADIFQAMDQQH